jgi:hypothetical protein
MTIVSSPTANLEERPAGVLHQMCQLGLHWCNELIKWQGWTAFFLKAGVAFAEQLYEYLSGLALIDKVEHPVLGKPEEQIALMLQKR